MSAERRQLIQDSASEERFLGLDSIKKEDLKPKFYQDGIFKCVEIDCSGLSFGPLKSLIGYWSPANNKNYTADGLVIGKVNRDQMFNTINVALLDGVTPASGLNPVFSNLNSLSNGRGSDYVLPELVRQNPFIIENTGYYFPASNPNNSVTQRMWSNLNELGLKYCNLPEFPNCPSSERPGVTGCMVNINPGYIEYTSIADTFILVVSKTGEINPFMVSNNSKYDKETVMLIRSMIKKGIAKDSFDARKQLFASGYYPRSYNNKVNKGVPVCNISKDFERNVRLLPTVRLNTSSIAAMLFLTDGFTYHLQNVVKGISSAGVEKLVKNLLTKNLLKVEGLDTKTFNTKNPYRERESDDKTALIATFVDKEEIQRLANGELSYTL